MEFDTTLLTDYYLSLQPPGLRQAKYR